MRFRLHSLARRLLQLATALLVLLSLGGLFLFTLHSFYPNISIPYLLPAQKVTRDTVFYRRSWREPFEYDIKVYASQSDSITVHNAAVFFESAQLLWHVAQKSLEEKYPKYSAKVNVKIPESMFDETNKGLKSLYAHVFIQKSDQFTPHPNISDPYLAYSPTDLFSTFTSYDKNAWVPSMVNTIYYMPELNGITKHRPLLSWDLVLEDQTYTNETLPKILRRLDRDHPDEESKTGTYNPPLIYRPASGHWTVTTVPAEGMPKPTGSNGKPSSPANTARITSLDVELKIQGISQGWVRGEDAIMKLAEPKYGHTKFSSGFLPSFIMKYASVLSVVLLVLSMPLVVALLLTAFGDIVTFWSREGAEWEGTSRLVVVLEVLYQCGSLAAMYMGYIMYGRRNILAYYYSGLSLWVFAAFYNIPLNPFMWRRRIFSLHAPPPREIPKPVLARNDDSSLTTTRASELPRMRGRDLAASTQQEVDQLLKRWLLWLGTPLLVLYLVYTAATLRRYIHRWGLIYAAERILYAIRAFQLVPQVIINYRTKSVAWIPITAYMCELLVNIHQILVVWTFGWTMLFSPVPADTNWVYCFLLAVFAVQWAKYYKAKQD
ncbi:hypothetical protein GQ54DRAFT_314314 [Martensiomyces pterosporus]|nr:hypothetical protein GQ54DRAFT_314314 [Martensiomyces pterosporus]